jgi:DUF1009 family protein
MAPLGLIAGEGVFPVLVARGARAAGRRVVCAALARNAWPELADEVDEFRWVGITRLGRWIDVLRRGGCEEAIMVGRVHKSAMYDRWRYFRYIPDARTVRVWFTTMRHDKRPGTPGVMTRRQPTDAQWIDIKAGWDQCSALSRMDIGQAIAVLNRDVIAVEALEGTNAMIERAGQLCRVGGWTLIKVSNSEQDMRMDVPSIGTTTIEKLHAARAGCLVLEAGKTILLEKQKVLELADRCKIAVVGWPMDGMAR